MACGEPFRSELCSAPRTEFHKPLLIPSTLFTIPAPIREFNSGLIVPWFGRKKFDTYASPAGVSRSPGDEITEVRARVRKNIFPARFGKVRPDIGLRYDNRPGAFRSGFSLNAIIPPGRSQFILEARSDKGPWETFFVHPVRGAIFREQLDGEWEAAGDYARWIRCYDRLQREDIQKIREQIAKFHYSPLISILLPVYNSNLKWLRRAISSVQQQFYPRWELCIVDDASTDRRLWPFLQKCARRDRRIKVMRRTENGHISAASNDALRLATGDFVALLDHDDELASYSVVLRGARFE